MVVLLALHSPVSLLALHSPVAAGATLSCRYTRSLEAKQVACWGWSGCPEARSSRCTRSLQSAHSCQACERAWWC